MSRKEEMKRIKERLVFLKFEQKKSLPKAKPDFDKEINQLLVLYKQLAVENAKMEERKR